MLGEGESPCVRRQTEGLSIRTRNLPDKTVRVCPQTGHATAQKMLVIRSRRDAVSIDMHLDMLLDMHLDAALGNAAKGGGL